jgi:hypothetical protein
MILLSSLITRYQAELGRAHGHEMLGVVPIQWTGR